MSSLRSKTGVCQPAVTTAQGSFKVLTDEACLFFSRDSQWLWIISGRGSILCTPESMFLTIPRGGGACPVASAKAGSGSADASLPEGFFCGTRD